MRRRPFPVRARASLSRSVRIAARACTLAAPLALTACHAALLDPKGPIGHANRTILLDSLAIMLAIVIPTIVATFAFAWWFRASNRKSRYLPDWEFSGSIELVVWAIPLMTILLLGGVTWISSYDLDPAKPIEGKGPALDVQVVSLDWKWLFIYPEQRVASVNELVVPAGRPLHFSLTSSSVMNAFFVPQLGSMIYTMNGMATQLWLHADDPGTYRGMSAHYSGEGFSDMHFDVKAVTPAQFAAWVNRTRDVGPQLDGDRYEALTKQSIKDPVSVFGLVDIDLFDRIVTNDLAPGAGPGTEDKGAHQAPENKDH